MNRHLPLIIILIMFISGCATPTARESGDEALVLSEEIAPASEDIQDLLIKADRASVDEAQAYRVRAAELAAANDDARQTELILALIQRPLPTPRLSRRYLIVRAKLALLQGHPQQAIQWTQARELETFQLDRESEIELGKIRAQAYVDTRSYVASARERIFFNNLLPPEDRAKNQELIFSTLLKLPADSLTNHAKDAVTSDLRGWLALAALTKRYQDSPLRQLEEVERWQQAWSQHPAARDLPAGLKMLSTIVDEQPEVIALLLPLRGNLGPYGRAIRDGILGTHYKLGGTSTIRVYDTAPELEIASVIDRARKDGAELIIGPLDRDKVTRIAEIEDLEIPVLALNRTVNGAIHRNLYQFGLAPEDEMIQVAEHAWEAGHRHALAIYPTGEWGERNFQTFKEHWETLGGTIVDSTDFSERNDYSPVIKHLLNVDKSEKRAADLKRIIGRQFEFTPRRRQDVDFVFLLATRNQARGINPTLAFYYAEDLPVYSTSHVYEQGGSRIEAIDLNGIRFCDIPWKLTETGEIQKAIQSTWEASSAELSPFYALGVDAYRIYPRLQQLKELPDQRVFGATGILRLNPGNVLARQLMWGQFRDGTVISLPSVVSIASNR